MRIECTNDFVTDVVNTYSSMIVRIAYNYLFRQSDAEDIMQEVFLALMKEKGFASQQHLKAWLIKVTINKSKNYLKKRNKETLCEDFNHYLVNDQKNEVMMCLSELSELDRNIIYLFYFEGYQAKEIGSILGMKENAIFTRLSRARNQLKNILEENYE